MREVCLSFQIGGHPRITPGFEPGNIFRFKLNRSYQLGERETSVKRMGSFVCLSRLSLMDVRTRLSEPPSTHCISVC